MKLPGWVMIFPTWPRCDKLVCPWQSPMRRPKYARAPPGTHNTMAATARCASSLRHYWQRVANGKNWWMNTLLNELDKILALGKRVLQMEANALTAAERR